MSERHSGEPAHGTIVTNMGQFIAEKAQVGQMRAAGPTSALTGAPNPTITMRTNHLGR